MQGVLRANVVPSSGACVAALGALGVAGGWPRAARSPTHQARSPTHQARTPHVHVSTLQAYVFQASGRAWWRCSTTSATGRCGSPGEAYGPLTRTPTTNLALALTTDPNADPYPNPNPNPDPNQALSALTSAAVLNAAVTAWP
jgi:hypothetical protein